MKALGGIQSPLENLCQCHWQGFALSCPGIFFSQVNAQTELMMKRKYKKLKVVVPYLYNYTRDIDWLHFHSPITGFV